VHQHTDSPSRKRGAFSFRQERKGSEVHPGHRAGDSLRVHQHTPRPSRKRGPCSFRQERKEAKFTPASSTVLPTGAPAQGEAIVKAVDLLFQRNEACGSSALPLIRSKRSVP